MSFLSLSRQRGLPPFSRKGKKEKNVERESVPKLFFARERKRRREIWWREEGEREFQ